MNRTTILLDPILFKRLKKLAQKEGYTLTELIQNFIRLGLDQSKKVLYTSKAQLPSFEMGEAEVDPVDRSRLWDLMDQR